MVKKDLAKVIEVCESMSWCYQEYLTLGKDICAVMAFKDYIYLSYGFLPKVVDEESLKSNKPLKEEETPKEESKPL